ncbi:MAG: S8 family serine peptidase [Bryobacterales bacterium]|nr:S8 family serine peptidase [Bryobacterales bacterium]
MRLTLVVLGLLTLGVAQAQTISGRYILELAGEPAATYAAKRGGTRQAATERREALAAEQQQVRRAVMRLGGDVRDSVDTVFNGLFVRVSDDRLAELRQLPGVARVHPVRQVRARLDGALTIHKVPDAWGRVGGYAQAGAGMKIAILDSGIDNTHPGFAGDLPALEGFPQVSGPQNQGLVNSKVIVARSYESLNEANYGTDARDFVGHGTNAAFAAAGVGWEIRGITIAGAAPAAYLGNYKVLGNTGGGSTESIIKGIDDAVKDGMDVINMSLGSDIPADPASDPQVAAVQAAVEAGVLVIAAAGNAGPDENTINSPGTAPLAITVGSSSNNRGIEGDQITPKDPRRVSDFSSRGPNFGPGLKPDVLATGDSFLTADSTLKNGEPWTVTQGTSFATPVVAGAAALLKAARPGLTPLTYRSLLINTAEPLVYANGQAAPIRFAGAGRLDMMAALQATTAVSPTAIKFGAGEGTVDLAQNLVMVNLGSSRANYTLTVNPFPGSQAQPVLSSGAFAINPGEAAAVQVRFSGTGLAEGEYQGRIVIRSDANQTAVTVPYWYAVSSTTASSITVLENPEGKDAQEPAGETTFGLRLLDRSGVPVDEPITVTALCGGEVLELDRAPEGVPGLTFVRAKTGDRPGASVFRVDGGGIRRYVQIGVSGTLDAQTTNIPACALTNGASFVWGDVAPGSFASIFGNRLAAQEVVNSQLPMPAVLGGTSVSVNGVPAPLFYVSPAQINLQVPFEVAAGPATATVSIDGAPAATVDFTVSPSAPGVLQYGESRAVAVNADGSINSADKPAAAGSSLVVYATGQGAVDNPVSTGSPAAPSGDPLSLATGETTVKIGDTVVKPFFSGLTPGFVALLQVNLIVPQLPPGTYPMLLTIGGAPSKAVLVTVK